MKTCPVCQKVLTDQAKFCFFCGASLLNADTEPAPAAEPEASEPIVPEAPESIEPAASEAVEPVFAETPEPVVVPEPEPVVVPEPEPVASPEPEPVASPEPEPIHASEPAPKAAEPDTKQPIVLASDSRSLMSTAGYIFTTILFGIPVVGLVFMIIWGCGKTKNLSLKRFSLAGLIMRLILYILLLAGTVFLLVCFSNLFPELTQRFTAFWEAVRSLWVG